VDGPWRQYVSLRLYVYSADGNYEVSYKPNVVLHNTGKILWIPIAIYKSSCIINVQYFPFDEQTCEMVFGSWTFDADQVTLGWYEGEPKVRLNQGHRELPVGNFREFPGIHHR